MFRMKHIVSASVQEKDQASAQAVQMFPRGPLQPLLIHLTMKWWNGTWETKVAVSAMLHDIVGHKSALQQPETLTLADTNLTVQLMNQGCPVDAWMSSSRWLLIDLSAKVCFLCKQHGLCHC
jgi:hypothetical protein